jgi:hypothetical protein
MLAPSRSQKLVYSTRWFDDEADQSDRPPTIKITSSDERQEALAQRKGLPLFLKTEAQSRIASV